MALNKLLASLGMTTCFVWLMLAMTGCYSFTGASIPPEMKTIIIDYFPNKASIVNPTLSSEFTDGLRTYISLQEISEGEPDAEITGEITAYTLTPMAAQSDAQAALQRLTITIKVNFSNNINSKDSFSQSFSVYRDFDSDIDFNSVESELVKEITDELVDQIFMQAFGNW